MKTFFATTVSLALGLTSLNAQATEFCPKPWKCEAVPMTVPYKHLVPVLGPGPIPLIPVPIWFSADVSIRAGYLEASDPVPFKGNILYLEGLADSMMNHLPFFRSLTQQGYRVISFDYMGQGQSTGNMNNTRIHGIRVISEEIWKRMARDTQNFPTRTVIGWSTGGLAAYTLALEGKADRVILIAPGLAPKVEVGGGLMKWPPNEITLESLTSDTYGPENPDPHIDPISPNTPFLVPSFSADLLWTAYRSKGKPVSEDVQGIVFLGTDDSYVDSDKTSAAISEIAPQFQVKFYPGGRHELHNEKKWIREKLTQRTLQFLRAAE